MKPWVESSWKRTNSLQDDDPDSASWRGEPPHSWRSLVSETIERVETTAKATLGQMAWLGVGCSEGKAK